MKTLYHQTGPGTGPLILRNGFQAGRVGWCGGGIYFAVAAHATKGKAIGIDSQQGYIVEAKVDVGKVKHMSSTCDKSMTGSKLHAQGYDSISFNPGDGGEYVVYSSARILSTRHYKR